MLDMATIDRWPLYRGGNIIPALFARGWGGCNGQVCTYIRTYPPHTFGKGSNDWRVLSSPEAYAVMYVCGTSHCVLVTSSQSCDDVVFVM